MLGKKDGQTSCVSLGPANGAQACILVLSPTKSVFFGTHDFLFAPCKYQRHMLPRTDDMAGCVKAIWDAKAR